MQQLEESDLSFTDRIVRLRDAMTFGCRREELYSDVETALSIRDPHEDFPARYVTGMQEGREIGRRFGEDMVFGADAILKGASSMPSFSDFNRIAENPPRGVKNSDDAA